MKLKVDLRSQILSKVKKFVVKIGTGVFTTENGYVDKEQIQRLAGQTVELKKMVIPGDTVFNYWHCF